jgi:hypothetical protein
MVLLKCRCFIPVVSWHGRMSTQDYEQVADNPEKLQEIAAKEELKRMQQELRERQQSDKGDSRGGISSRYNRPSMSSGYMNDEGDYDTTNVSDLKYGRRKPNEKKRPYRDDDENEMDDFIVDDLDDDDSEEGGRWLEDKKKKGGRTSTGSRRGEVCASSSLDWINAYGSVLKMSICHI